MSVGRLRGFHRVRGLLALAVALVATPSRAQQLPPRPLPPASADTLPGMRCTAQCDRLFEAGRYRILLEPTEHVAGTMTSIDIATPGPYRVTGVPRSRRAPGLVLGATGIVLTAVGAGMALGAGAFRSGLTASEERWFWAGVLTLGTGATLTPLGFKMYSRTPRVDALATNGTMVRASNESSLPKRYREPPLGDQEVPPAGTTAIDEPRWGLLSAGAITFAASYGIMAGIAAGYAADGNDDGKYTALLIPFIGPTIVDRREHGDGGWTILGSIPQLAGGVLMLCGVGASRRISVANDTALVVTPLVAPHASGLQLTGAF